MTIGKICPASFSTLCCLMFFCYKDIGVSFDNSLSFDSHISIIYSKCIYYIVACYNSYCRPILECSSSIWSSNKHYLNIFDRLEKVQRYFTRKLLFRFMVIFLIHLLTKKSYDNHLALFYLESLELRRLKYDLFIIF